MNETIRLLPDPPARLLKLDLYRRAQAVDFLRRMARAIEEGEVAADAVVVVTSWGDVHDVTWAGYQTFPILGAATQSAHDAYWSAVSGRKYDPDEAALRRLANRQYRDQEIARKLAEKPWACACGDRFRTERGRDAHIRRPSGWRWGKREHGVAQVQAPVPLAVVVEDAAGE
jgi:hypothetical protein